MPEARLERTRRAYDSAVAFRLRTIAERLQLTMPPLPSFEEMYARYREWDAVQGPVTDWPDGWMWKDPHA